MLSNYHFPRANPIFRAKNCMEIGTPSNGLFRLIIGGVKLLI